MTRETVFDITKELVAELRHLNLCISSYARFTIIQQLDQLQRENVKVENDERVYSLRVDYSMVPFSMCERSLQKNGILEI